MNNQSPSIAEINASSISPLTWSQDHRLKFIDFRLRWEGRINRTHLTQFFKISMAQASIDLAKYSKSAPDNFLYDAKAKTYVRSDRYLPIYSRSAALTFLNELLAINSRIMEPESSFIGWSPEVGIAPIPSRQINGINLMVVLQALRESRMLQVEYQSMHSDQPSVRILSPHALVFDGFRWHLRAYCHLRQGFRDFVIARLSNLTMGELTTISPMDDQQWQTKLTLELGPHPGLSVGSRKAIEMDYGMIDGQVKLICRHALLFYSLRRLGLSSTDIGDAAAQQIMLLNRDEMQPFIDQLTAKKTL